MAFIVQDDSGGVVDANAYIDATFFKDYHKDRGHDLPSGSSTGVIQRAIVRATDFLDVKFDFIGDRLLSDQTTEWPRLDAQDKDGRVVNGVPPEVQEATAEYALISLRMEIDENKNPQDSINPTPERDATGQPVRRRASRVGPISEDVSFSVGGVSGSVFEMPRYPIADEKLRQRGLIRNKKFGMFVRGD